MSEDDPGEGYHYGDCWDCGAPDQVLDEGGQCSDCRVEDEDEDEPPRP